MTKGKPHDLKTNAGRMRVNLNGAVDPLTLEVVVRQDESITSEAVIKLLEQLEAKHSGSGTIYFICDNARYYKSKELAEWLANSRVEMVYLPPYSPNLNIIERLWKYFRKEVMANRYYATFVEFRRATFEFFR